MGRINDAAQFLSLAPFYLSKDAPVDIPPKFPLIKICPQFDKAQNLVQRLPIHRNSLQQN